MRDSSKGRTRFGIATTIAWLAVVASVMWLRRADIPKLTLEQWGTFFGGVTGPIAFFWLILGYLQQGEELKLNTEALNLQQQELQHQVAETAQLVRHAEAQSRATIDAVTIERERDAAQKLAQHIQAQLLLRYAGGSSSGANGELKYQNAGGRARRLQLSVVPEGTVSISPTDVLESGAGGVIYYKGVTTFPALVTVTYTDDFGTQQSIELDVTGPGHFRQRD